MTVKTRHTEENALYFCTFTCFKWISLIEMTNSYDEVYNFFDILNAKQNDLYGYVIMPNHVHLIARNTDGKLNTNFSNGKRFIAYELVERLKKIKRYDILNQMSDAVTPSDRKAGKLHQVFQDSFDGKLLWNNELVYQKLRYMHLNPVSKKWRLVEDYLDYPHSSARFYELGEAGKVKITHYLG